MFSLLNRMSWEFCFHIRIGSQLPNPTGLLHWWFIRNDLLECPSLEALHWQPVFTSDLHQCCSSATQPVGPVVQFVLALLPTSYIMLTHSQVGLVWWTNAPAAQHKSDMAIALISLICEQCKVLFYGFVCTQETTSDVIVKTKI